MSSKRSDGWYQSHFGEPLEPDHVRGYWVFIFGAVLAIAALGVFLAASTFERGDTFFQLREIAFTLALLSGPISVIGVLYLMPLRKQAIRVGLIGALVCFVAIGLFIWSYPDQWNWATADRSATVMAVYGGGIGIQLLTMLLYPLVSNDPVPDEATVRQSAESSVPETVAGGRFELYQSGDGTWHWQLFDDTGTVLAESSAGFDEQADAQAAAERIREQVPGADIDIGETPAIPPNSDNIAEEVSSGEALSKARFELYEDRRGEYRWRLRHQNGNIIADGGEGYTKRREAENAIDRLQTNVDSADTLEYDPAGYELYLDGADEWRWRLRHKNGRILADSAEGYASRSNAREAIERVRSVAEGGERFEVYEDSSGRYRWRLKAGNGEIIADSGQGYSRENEAHRAVERVRKYAPEADTLDYDPLGFEVYKDKGDEWRWRLRHRNGNILADSSEGYSSKQKAKQGLQSVMQNGPTAEQVEV